ncbi:hypothetical protein FPOAC1_012814 [Fusarium poae]|uniref:hypothetical protein n=1 Tax=Fusarium poae TaxID=36050 RepID=UPI001CEA7427|nr:hypothetical protein FPOAC1_012814 [Fusarium poae]KAG8667972.1 hypothetical protein FPOAC1_012814 [Fusarium poae]
MRSVWLMGIRATLRKQLMLSFDQSRSSKGWKTTKISCSGGPSQTWDSLDKAETALVEILDIHAAKWGVDDTHSFKTGKILYGLGNVLESKGQFSESLEFHVRCLQQYKAVLGMKHHRVGDVCHRLAGHYMRLELYEEARGYIDTALEIFQSRSYLINEYARTAVA